MGDEGANSLREVRVSRISGNDLSDIREPGSGIEKSLSGPGVDLYHGGTVAGGTEDGRLADGLQLTPFADPLEGCFSRSRWAGSKMNFVPFDGGAQMDPEGAIERQSRR